MLQYLKKALQLPIQEQVLDPDETIRRVQRALESARGSSMSSTQ